MRLLLLHAEAVADLARLRALAERPENLWRPFDTGPLQSESFSAYIPFGYRVVYTLTQVESGLLFRHVSVSVDTPGRLPNIPAVFTLACELGFEGGSASTPGADWIIEKDASGVPAILQAICAGCHKRLLTEPFDPDHVSPFCGSCWISPP